MLHKNGQSLSKHVYRPVLRFSYPVSSVSLYSLKCQPAFHIGIPRSPSKAKQIKCSHSLLSENFISHVATLHHIKTVPGFLCAEGHIGAAAIISLSRSFQGKSLLTTAQTVQYLFFSLVNCSAANIDGPQTSTNRIDLATSFPAYLNVVKSTLLVLFDKLLSLVGVSGCNALNNPATSRPVVINHSVDLRLLRVQCPQDTL